MLVFRTIILILFSIGLNYSFAQKIGTLTLSDDFPGAGKTIKMNYEITDSSITTAKNIKALVYYLDDKNYPVDEVSRTQIKPNQYSAEILIPDSTKAFIIKIDGEGIYDNNNGIGYVFLIYENQKPVKGAYGQVAFERIDHTSEDYPQKIGLKEDIEAALKNYEKEFSLYPPAENSKELMRYYFVLTRSPVRTKESVRRLIQEKINSLRDSSNDDDILFAADLLRLIMEQTRADSLEESALQRIPHGKLKKKAMYNSFFKDDSTNRRASEFESYIKEFPIKDAQSDLLAEQTAVAFLEEGKFDKFNRMKVNMKDTAYLILMVNNVAEDWARKKIYLPQAESLSIEAMKISKDKLDAAVSKDYLTIMQIREIYQHNYDLNCSIHNYVLCQEGRVNEALKLQYPLYIRNKNNGEIARSYALMLMADKNYQEARTVSESNRADYFSFFDDILKQCYIKINGSEKGFQHYKDSLTTADRAKEKNSYIESISINKPAPAFTAVGLDGKLVSLSDFKGKTVILAFWASWQTSGIPYTAAVNDVIQKFKSNQGVVFLFMNTWAEGDRNDVINKLLRAGGYDFNVLVDKTPEGKYNTIVRLFTNSNGQIVYIIDKKGNIRINGLCYFGDSTRESFAEDLLAQLDKIASQ